MSIPKALPRAARFVLMTALLWAAIPGAGPVQAAESYEAYARRSVAGPPKGARFRPDLEKRLDELASTVRRREGREPLKASKKLRIAARAQALDVLKTGRVGHLSARGERFARRFEAFNDDDFSMRGENVLRGRKVSPDAGAQAAHLMSVWLGSSGHRRNLMARGYEYVSTGVVEKGGLYYAVQLFWAPKPEQDSSVCLLGC